MSQPSGADRMFANMLEFLRARTWEGSLLILRAHPELMNDAGYAVLGLIASDPEMASFIYPQLDRDERESLIQRHYALLGRSREVGPLPAFVELVHDVTMRKWAVALTLELADAAGGASSTPTLAIPGPGGTPQAPGHHDAGPQLAAASRRGWRWLLVAAVAILTAAAAATGAAVSRNGNAGPSAPSVAGPSAPGTVRATGVGTAATPGIATPGVTATASVVPPPPPPVGEASADPVVGPAQAQTGSAPPAPGAAPPPTPANVTVGAVDPPSFVYPANGQTLDFAGAYMVKVSAVAGASGYLFGFFQNGTMVWENYRDEGALSGPEYAIWPDTAAHAGFHVGAADVWVRALVSGHWTEARIITIHLAA